MAWMGALSLKGKLIWVVVVVVMMMMYLCALAQIWWSICERELVQGYLQGSSVQRCRNCDPVSWRHGQPVPTPSSLNSIRDSFFSFLSCVCAHLHAVVCFFIDISAHDLDMEINEKVLHIQYQTLKQYVALLNKWER